MVKKNPEKYRVVLVSAGCWNNDCPPLGISYLAAVLRKLGHKVKCLDLNIELYNLLKDHEIDFWSSREHYNWTEPYYSERVFPLIKKHLDEAIKDTLKFQPDFVGFTVYYTSSLNSLYFAQEIKKRKSKVKVLFGGPECYRSIYDSHLINSGYVDALVVGEGEKTLEELLKQYSKAKKIIPIKGVIVRKNEKNEFGGFRKEISDINKIPLPDYSDFDLTRYRRKVLPMMTSRGCIAKCAFCGEAKFWKAFRFRTAKNIFREIKRNVKQYGINQFLFNDSLINGNKVELLKLANLIIANKLEVSWGGYARIDKKMDFNFLKRLREAGCTHLSYGIESGSQKILNDMKKMITIKEAEAVLRDTTKAGIHAHVNWIVGFPTESWLDNLRSLLFVWRNKKNIEYFNPGQTPCGILSDSDLALYPERFGLVPKPFLNEWRTAFYGNTIIHRKIRAKMLRIVLNLAHLKYS